MKKKIVILASGGGSNAKAIFEHFEHHSDIEVCAVMSNRVDAGVHRVANQHNTPSFTFNKESRLAGKMIQKIDAFSPDLIVLAGYLLKIPAKLISRYDNKIVNIHPALLPKFGGKGMYGAHVHRAVIDAREKQSGITIHFVNENYDEGQIIKQVSCNVAPDDDAEILQKKVLLLEHKNYPLVIEELLS